MSRIFTSTRRRRPTRRNNRSWSPARWQRTSPSPSNLSARSDSQRHIDVCALEDGYLKAISIKEGQAVKKGDVMFKINPVLYQAKRDAKMAERDLAQLEMNYTKTLANKNGVSQNEVKLFEAKLARAQAKADQAKAELNFTKVKAPFDGIVDRLHDLQGSLVKEGDILTTLSDNSVMWVYFNVPEKAVPRIHGQLGGSIRRIGQNRARAGEPREVPAARHSALRSRPNSTTRPGTSPSGRISEPGRPAASRSDRHHPDPPNAQECSRHPTAGDVRAPRQAIRLGRRRG